MTSLCSRDEFPRWILILLGFGSMTLRAQPAATPLAGLIDPVTGLTFPDFNAPPTELTQTNLILPEPCDFLKGEKLPPCSVIRPSLTENGGAVATIKAFTDDLLFAGQSNEFFHLVMQLATEADAAQRDL